MTDEQLATDCPNPWQTNKVLHSASGLAEMTRRELAERKIWAHYDHARQKHPYFCDRLIPASFTVEDAECVLKVLRDDIAANIGESDLCAFPTVLDCEISEAELSVVEGDTAHAIEECYDAIAVLLRIIDVLEGRQKLGRPEDKQ